MIVYLGSKQKFQADVMANDIAGIIYESYKAVTGRHTTYSEVESWRNSLQYMDRVLNDPSMPADLNVAIEYHIPQSSKRIDLLLPELAIMTKIVPCWLSLSSGKPLN